jgi:Uma2 family endonuclease
MSLSHKPASHPKGISYAKFLEEYDDQHVEWVDGEVVYMAPVSDDHQQEGIFLLTVIEIFVEVRDLGVVRYEPFQMKTAPDLPGRSPDLMFIAKRNLGRIKKNYLQGPADMVIEIISPGSRAVDRGDKHYEYERGGVKEYWLIDPERKQAEFYVLGRNRIYRAANIDDGVFHSTVLKGFFVKLQWLWQRPTPSSVTVLKELGAL